MYPLIRPFLFAMDAETAHDTTLKLVNLARSLGLTKLYGADSLPTTCMGIALPNPVGLSAGLDKNGAYIDALSELGFGFIEIGTITPRPQAGNPKPRLHRVKEAHAIINKMGFNNAGVDALIDNVKRSQYKGVLGINIGKNKDTPNEKAVDDYLYCLERVYAHASYITVNISSPNTANLRELQSGENLYLLIESIKNAQAQLATTHGFYVPIALKIAPDLDDGQIDEIAKVLVEFEVDGLIATNTTVSRTGIEHLPAKDKEGGLSGRPVYFKSTEVLGKFHDRLAGKVELIGVGGIDSGETAVGKMKAGAKAVQLYSGLIYQGPALVGDCVKAIASYQNALKG